MLGLVAAGALLTSPSLGQEPLLSRLKGLKDVSIPLGPDSAAPSLHLRFAEIKSEPMRFGPFSFGLLPRRVIEGIEVRINCAQGSWTADLRRFLQNEPIMTGATLRNFRLLDREGSLLWAATEATIAQMPWRILLWDARRPGDDAEGTAVANLYLEGPEEGYLIYGEKSWKLTEPSEPRTEHEKK